MRTGRQSAFTIVELLIVIVVIGILATITIVAYNGVQSRARAASVSAALNQAVKKLAVYQITSSTFPATGSLSLAGVTDAAGGVTYEYTANTSANPQTYCITATQGTTSYYLNNTTTPNPTSGGCAGHGTGGVAAITNLASNPSIETNTAGLTSMQSTITRDASWYVGGANSVRIDPSGVSNDSFFTLGGDLGGFRTGMQASKTYTISATIRLTAPLTGAFGGNGTRQITAWYTSSVGTHVITRGTQAPNSAGQTRVSVTYTIPSDATGAWLRFYHGGASGSGSIWYDDIMVTEGSTLYNFADGSSSNWVWNGAANASTSTGPPL